MTGEAGRWHVLVVTLAFGLLAPAPGVARDAKSKSPPGDAPAAAAPVSGPEVRDFRSFCDTWMGKLRQREEYNTAHIQWEHHGDLVVGEHVAYGEQSSCTAREEPGKDAIGTITYREMRYRREGPTPADALRVQGTIIEQTDVTEIFRYAKGRWQY